MLKQFAFLITLLLSLTACHKQAEKPNTFKIFNNGTALDTKTNLIWMRCSLGQYWDGNTCKGDASSFTFDQIETQINAVNQELGYAGANNWRLPDAKELSSLTFCSEGRNKNKSITLNKIKTVIKGNCAGQNYQAPTINTQIFPNTPATFYWSSSRLNDNKTAIWTIYFGAAYLAYFSEGDAYKVRLVRNNL